MNIFIYCLAYKTCKIDWYRIPYHLLFLRLIAKEYERLRKRLNPATLFCCKFLYKDLS